MNTAALRLLHNPDDAAFVLSGLFCLTGLLACGGEGVSGIRRAHMLMDSL